MDPDELAVHVLRCPFGVREMQLTLNTAEPSVAGASLESDHYARILDSSEAPPRLEPQVTSYAVAGTRGIQQLVATAKNHHPSVRETVARPAQKEWNGKSRAAATSIPNAAPTLILSKHEKGRLLLWDVVTGTNVAAHSFNAAVTVHQCVTAASHLYTTVEGSPAIAGSEEETHVGVWDRLTLRSVAVLRGHEGRVTALAVSPFTGGAASAGVLIATASLDGTVRLWLHRTDVRSSERVMVESPSKSDASPVHALTVLSSTELGTIQALYFIAADVLVAACSRCAMAALRIPSDWARGDLVVAGGVHSTLPTKVAVTAAIQNGARHSLSELTWQLVPSPVNTYGCTTALHRGPLNQSDNTNRKSRACLFTGSTSGYIQEWTVDESDDIGEAHRQPGSPRVSATSTNTNNASASLAVRSRWHYKAHSATVDTLVTDEDVVVSTSIFDGAQMYHRISGDTCTLTTAAAVVVLVPQLRQLIWGTVHGALSIASYSAFAANKETTVRQLWTAQPHTSAIRGVCLSLTRDLQWDSLCTGAADGSMTVWRSSRSVLAERASSAGPIANERAAPATFAGHILDSVVAPRSDSRSANRCRMVAVAALTGNDKRRALCVTEMDASTKVTISTHVLPLPSESGSATDSITCAHFCYTGCEKRETDGSLESQLCLWVGTREGSLWSACKALHEQAWAPWRACHWTAPSTSAARSIAAISSMPTTAQGNVVMLAVIAESVAKDSAPNGTRRLMVSLIPTRLRGDSDHSNGTAAAPIAEGAASWTDYVELPAALHHASSSDNDSSAVRNETEAPYVLQWIPKAKPINAAAPTLLAQVGALLVRDTRHGLLFSCRHEADASTSGATTEATGSRNSSPPRWCTPEMLTEFSPHTYERARFTLAPSLDSAAVSDTVVTTEDDESDVVCWNVLTKRRRVLLSSSARRKTVGGALCDVGTAALRLAATCASSQVSSLNESVVALYDDQGKERYRLTRDGSIASLACSPASSSSFARGVKRLGYAPLRGPSASAQGLLTVSDATGACTALAASATDRLLFVGYEDGLLQMIDTTEVLVFVRVWVTDASGAARAIRALRYANRVVLVQLANDQCRLLVVPPRTVLDQPMRQA